MSSAWVDKAFSLLPGCDDDVFSGAWDQNKLQYHGMSSKDAVDYHNARLVSAAIKNKKSLFIVQPDNKLHRSALLFSTALLRGWADSRQFNSTLHTVLYFGSSIGIREQLEKVSYANLNLGSVFPQCHHSRNNSVSRKGTNGAVNLPQVITIYSPANPEKAIEFYKPRWIAVDCSDVSSSPWFKSLLVAAKERAIPVLAWGSNPLSSCISDFMQQEEKVFSWPAHVYSAPKRQVLEPIYRELDETDTIEIIPFVSSSPLAEKVSTALSEAFFSLIKAGKGNLGNLASDALSIHWRLLRAIENLIVPFSFYEAEVHSFWGLQSFLKMKEGCEKFEEACRNGYPDFSKHLREAQRSLDGALDLIENEHPPLWSSLCDLCLNNESYDTEQIVVFPNKTRKQLFLLALLSEHNVTEEELKNSHVWVCTPDDLQQWMSANDNRLLSYDDEAKGPFLSGEQSSWRVLIVGLPTIKMSGKLTPALLQKDVGFLLYPHQAKSLSSRMKEWGKNLSPNWDGIKATFSGLCNRPFPIETPADYARPTLASGTKIFSVGGQQKSYELPESFVSLDDAETEIERLLDIKQELETEPVYGTNAETDNAGSMDDESMWCEDAIEVSFEQGGIIRFAKDDKVNVIIRGAAHERHVRSLKPGDQIVFIHGQKRQSLYDLILSRVHNHPAIQLHLALIARWHKELKSGYLQWAEESKDNNTYKFLKLIQDKGSRIVSELAIQFWIKGTTSCPSDPEDLKRVSDVLDIEFVKENYGRIHAAAQRISGLHRGLSNRLNRWLSDGASSLSSAGRFSDDEIFDKELGLSFSDFKNSLLVLKVRDIQEINELCLRSSLGVYKGER